VGLYPYPFAGALESSELEHLRDAAWRKYLEKIVWALVFCHVSRDGFELTWTIHCKNPVKSTGDSFQRLFVYEINYLEIIFISCQLYHDSTEIKIIVPRDLSSSFAIRIDVNFPTLDPASSHDCFVSLPRENGRVTKWGTSKGTKTKLQTSTGLISENNYTLPWHGITHKRWKGNKKILI